MALSYESLVPVPILKPSLMPGYLAMAGGYYSTVGDMFRLMNGVLGGRMLGPDSHRALMTTVMPDQHYALGGRVRVAQIAGQAS